MGKYTDVLKQYNLNLTKEEADEKVEKIKKELQEPSKELLEELIGCIDLTTLNVTDTESKIVEQIEKLNQFNNTFLTIPNVAAFCSYPIFTEIVKEHLQTNMNICTVVGFPNPQTFLEVKIAETALSAAMGADEIDMVISVSKILEGKYDEAGEEIEEMKHACRDAKLKVILETGVYEKPEDIYKASLIALYAGADFIKTSTGKSGIGATPQAAYIMCKAIKDFKEKTDYKIGIKVAGGIRTIEDAQLYYAITEQVCGKEWLHKNYFRIGASKLVNTLLSKIEGKDVTYF